MTHWQDFFNKTALKISLIIGLIGGSLLITLNILTMNRINYSFHEYLFSSECEFCQTPQYYALYEQFQQNLNDTLFFATVTGIGISLLLGILAAGYITRPLWKLNSGLRKLRESNYNFKIPPTGSGEFDEVIDEFNALVRDLNKVEKLRKDLISDTSHELKTPLTSLSGQLQGIKDGIINPTPERIDMLTYQVDRLIELVNKLQEYTVIRSQTIIYSKEEIKLRKLIQQVLSSYEEDLRERGIEIKLKIRKSFTLECDRNLIERLFRNLIENMLKYSNATRVTIYAKHDTIIFEDNGIGVPKAHLKNIFERFYRVEKSRNRETGGLGLGLAIVKEIAEAHGWKIRAERNDPTGLRFVINID